MRRLEFLLILICSLIAFIALTPESVQAEGDPPAPPDLIQPPWITGQNLQWPAGSGISIPVQVSNIPALPPINVDTPKQISLTATEANHSVSGIELAVPQHYQDPDDPTCGAVALSMVLDFIALSEGQEAPDTANLIHDLDTRGLLYNTGTGAEELAYLARSYGFQGASPFHGWTLEQLAGELASGRPAIVSLGLNRDGQPGHFVTVSGIASDGSWVRYNDPVLGEQTVSAEEFLAAWRSQGYSGLTVQKAAQAAASDPLLPWMGLLGTVSILSVLARTYPLNPAFKRKLSDLRSLLSSPTRKGFGGKLVSPQDISASCTFPPYPAPPGFHWTKKLIPQYGWQDTQVTRTRQVPILTEQKVEFGTRVWYKKVPRYRTTRVDKGDWAWRKVTKTRKKKYVRYYRTTRQKKIRWVRKNGRFSQETTYVTKRTPVYGYKKIPYTAWERYWKPKWVTEQVVDGFTQVRQEEPIYETRMVPSGSYRTETYTDCVPEYKQIGTTAKWILKKDPTPLPTTQTPTPTPLPLTIPVPLPIPNPQPGIESTPSVTTSPPVSAESTPTPTSPYEWPFANLVTPTPPEELETYHSPPDYLQLESDIEDIKKLKKVLSPLISIGRKIIAGGNINITQADDLLYIYGPRASRATVGFNPYTNWIKSENVANILNSADEFKLSKSSVASTTLGLTLNIASNSIDLAQGDIDRYEYAAALTVDTGITAGTALVAGAITGFVSGALIGGIAGVGIGAVPGALFGAIAGGLSVLGLNTLLKRTRIRDEIVVSVADMYRRWVNQE